MIREGLRERRLRTGYGLILRYVLKLSDDFTPENIDLDAQRVTDYILHAVKLEGIEEQCVAHSFEPAVLRLPRQLQYDILNLIVTFINRQEFCLIPGF